LVDLVAKYRRGEIPPKGKEVTDRNTDRNAQTVLLAKTPTRFHVENIPKASFLVIPETGSERRRYLPVGFMSPGDGLCSNLVKMMPDATLFHFAVLSSAMHMAWMRHVGGRMKSDPRYSVKLVYNNFPWPQTPSAKQRHAVEAAAQAVLNARKKFPDATLADLYDPLTMQPALVKAHADLDRAVDLCYRPQPFQNDRQRVEHLFALYEKLTAPLIAPAKKRRRKSPSN
jgi:MmeI, target recognition domain/MmeI, C-terminal domain